MIKKKIYLMEKEHRLTHKDIKVLLKIMWSSGNLKKLDVNICETMNFRHSLSENELLIYTIVFLDIKGPSCYHQISKEILKFTKD